MEAKQEQPSRHQDTDHLSQRKRNIAWRQVDDCIKRRDTSPSIVCNRKGSHVALTEINPWIQLPRTLNHCRRYIHAADLDCPSQQIARNMSRTATEAACKASMSKP